MSETAIHIFHHRAMATQFQVRISDDDKAYAAQAAQAAFTLLDDLESRLSRFRENSEISQISHLAPGEILRLTEPVYACLEIALKMQRITNDAFSASPAALCTQPVQPKWSLLRERFSIRCDSGKLEFDLGAIGKGFALDRMAEVLREWSCGVFMLVAGGSSILAGDAPPGTPGWLSNLADDKLTRSYRLKNCSLSGSGLAVKGAHIIDPRTGAPAQRTNRAWALALSAAESDALSTACMVLDEAMIPEVVANLSGSLVWLLDGNEWKEFGKLDATRITAVE